MNDIKIQTPKYALNTGIKGTNNLDFQHKIFENDSYDHLQKAGLSKGKIIWDIGCGSGIITEYLAKMVGDNGYVYAMDISQEQIKIAQERIKSSNQKNVEFITDNIENIDPSKYKKADIIFSRFLLMHLNNPINALKIMSSLLKENGVISSEEPSMDSFKQNKLSNPYLNKFYNLLISYGKLQNVDYNIGKKLENICKELNIFSKIQSYSKKYTPTENIKKLISLRLDELEYNLINSNLTSKDEYKILKENIRNFLKSDKSNEFAIIAEQFYLLAYK